ncbi:hypothetical protein HZY91_00500 [Facklamia sp. DSM 111018]|uniref:O-antigen polysaccharide polymerase Wzy n=1 Tax=Facklamia lactis TaxID=2749967 RepID=A0ABS0LMH8_9LACT|nr:hypothetical protein [Facklamia lactis]MBG9979952.1 hypothetical protein [Facklamia lactis]MBG9985368.1 hypothetical protein [Facklamia lactis]
MYNTRRKFYEWLLLLFVIMTSIVSIISIAQDELRTYSFDLLWVLPLTYVTQFIISWLYFPHMKYKISVLLILALYYARMIIVPFAMFLGNYSTYGIESVYGQDMGLAISLMSWEFMVITILFVLTTGKSGEENDEDISNGSVNNVFNIPQYFKWAVICIILYIVLIMIGTPGLFQESFFLTTGRSEESYELLFSGEVSHNAFGLSFGSQLVTIAFTFFWILQAIYPPFLLAQIANKVKSQFNRNILFLIVLGGTVLISTEGRAHSIECAIALLISSSIALKNKFYINIKALILVITGIMIYGLMDKSGVSGEGSQLYVEFSKMISAYFGGPHNVATAITMKNNEHNLTALNIVSDILQRLPYLTIIFTKTFGGTTNIIFNNYFGGYYLGQIIPSIGLGYAYFGFLFAPIIPSAAVMLSLHFEKKASQNANVVLKNFYYLGVIMFARATCTSNMLSGITYLGNMFFAWLVIYIGFIKKTKDMGET